MNFYVTKKVITYIPLFSVKSCFFHLHRQTLIAEDTHKLGKGFQGKDFSILSVSCQVVVLTLKCYNLDLTHKICSQKRIEIE